MSSVLSYPNLTICSDLCAIYSRIEPAITFELRWVLIGITIAVVGACLILAALILTREEKASSEPRAQKMGLLEAMLIKVAEKTATPEETREPVETLASEDTAEEKVLLTPPQTTTAESITEAKELVLSEARLQVQEQSQEKQLRESLSLPYLQTTLPLGITELKVDPHEARPGETVTISFKVTNMNDVPGYYSVTLRINGVVMATKGVSLVRRSAMRLAFTVVETLPGDYKVDINGSTGRLTIVREMQQTFLCPKCGTQNYVSCQFCRGCGSRLFAGGQLQVSSNRQVCTCHTCGRKVVDGYKFCGSCGTPVKA